MRRIISLSVILILSFFCVVPQSAQASPWNARDYFRDGSNYDAYSMGQGRIHYKVLIFAEGNGHNNNAGNGGAGSRIWTRTSGSSTYPNFIHYYSDNSNCKPGVVSGRPRDKGWVRIKVEEGIVVVTNAYNGDNPVFTADNQWHDVDVRRNDVGDHLTYLEFDWYVPSYLTGNNISFVSGVESVYHESGGSTYEHRQFILGNFNSGGGDQQPQLVNPIFYTANGIGTAGYGMLAVPYVSFQQTYQYYTAWNPARIPCHEQSGMIYVPSCDSVQHGFYINMETRSSQSTSTVETKQWLKSSKVNIPAYHRIYDMNWSPYYYLDEESGLYISDYRYRKITWKLKLPYEEDIVPNDAFEIQRAYRSDYSDAQTIATIPIEWARDSVADSTYEYVDSSMAAWSNLLDYGNDVFYRVRRVSAALWGWTDHPFAASVANMAGVNLLHFRSSEQYFEADEDFSNNHKVHIYLTLFSAHFGNGTLSSPRYTRDWWDRNAKMYVEKILDETHDTIRIQVPNDTIEAVLWRMMTRPTNQEYLQDPVIHIVDELNTPCVHYRYRYYIDTTGIILKPYLHNPNPADLPLRGTDPYFTDAAGLSALSASQGEWPDHVLLTWNATEGGVDEYVVEARPDSNSYWRQLGSTTNNYWRDEGADPTVSAEWQYRVTMNYTCQGTTVSDSRTTTGSRSPWGRISGRVQYEDGTSCPGITLAAIRISDNTIVQRASTDASGVYLFDSLPYGGTVGYNIVPTSQSAQFIYDDSQDDFATVYLSTTRCVVTNIDFDNISSVRISGRVLYENSSIPVRDANLLLNGITVQMAHSSLKTDASGNFELCVPRGSDFTLQVVKPGHQFADSGFVHVNNSQNITLLNSINQVRIWDRTKVRLAGRVTGGMKQQRLPLGFGLSTNNLGDDLKLVLELEGDNVSYIVRVPSDLTKDTLEYSVPHLVYNGTDTPDTTGWTHVHYSQRRIIIEPDSLTGEYCADLFPVRYKVTQATATGYSTLFGNGRASETLDLTAAATRHDTSTYNSRYTTFNSRYLITYRSPISITCKQLRYGVELDYFGELTMQRLNIQNELINVPLASLGSDGEYHYLFGAPVFKTDRYDFRAYAHEDYYYNNDPDDRHYREKINGGTLTVYNGMYDSTNTQVFSISLDTLGKAEFSIPVNYASFTRGDANVQRVLDLSVESDGDYVESQAVRAYVTGHRRVGNDVATHGGVHLLDVLRDPPGSGSSAYLETGTEYSFSFTYDFKFRFGMEFGLTLGTQASTVIGVYAGVGGGMFSGQNLNISNTTTFSLPVTSSYYSRHEGNYTFRTGERISTSSSQYDVGQDADVYIGLVQNVYFRRMDAVQPIDSLTYAALSARSANGTMATVGEGSDHNGNHYYLVIGSEVETGPTLKSTFIYTHSFIESTVIPQLERQRDALLLTCDSASAQAIANSRNAPVYWSRVPTGDSNWACYGHYRQLLPAGSTKGYIDQVDSCNRLITDWVKIMIQNETEKVAAIHSRSADTVTTYSLSSGATVSYSNDFSYSNAYHTYWDYPGASFSMGDIIKNIGNLFGKSVLQLIGQAFNNVNQHGVNSNGNADPIELLVNSPGSATRFTLTPVVDLNWSRDPMRRTTHTRRVGFTLANDPMSHIDVSVYRIKESFTNYFNDSSATTRSFVASSNDYDGSRYLYGSLVYYLRGGATKCPCEVADSTDYYKPAMPISAGTLQLENQKIDIDVHERSNVPVDRPALFNLRMYNELEHTLGAGGSVPISFTLKLNDQSNPHGARIYIDGMPLTDGRTISLLAGQVVNKTMEVYAGDGYDFENLVLELASTCISSHKAKVQFSVHFMPVSCNVTLTSPHQGWVLNTLSPQDSVGYYLPVSISDFDVNYRGFDHIELQYKLSTHSDDGWVNLCSYYADSALYTAASGTKAMIIDGRIDNVRFYGERDPIEQRYDLRAVSFCRHGSGYIHKESPVLSGIKDTRCPRVFGQPEPANSILGVGDNLLLRFNEPIAGNYLDEDNNFQLLGVTNSSGIASSTSIYFDGTPSCGASSAVERILTDKSFSIDLMIKPFSPTISRPMELFGHTTAQGGVSFGIEPVAGSSRCRLFAYINEYEVHSLPLEPLTDFRRVVMTYDNENHRVQFFAGTENITDPNSDNSNAPSYVGVAPLVFGHGYKGNMLEARVWTKVLSQNEIGQTHLKRLTGYERKLAAYYPMNEGRGETMFDKASGTNLSIHGAAWTIPAGYSLHLNGSQAVTLNQEVLSRSNIQDYTLMFWFRTTEYNVPLFSAGMNGNHGMLIAFENGLLTFRNNNMVLRATGDYANGLWHHYVLAVNRTFNNASIYVDGQMVNTFSTDSLGALGDVMMLGGVPTTPGGSQQNLFRGNIDDFVLFEQALPKSLVETYDNLSPQGDELGLIALLTFSEQKENSNNIMEEIFSVNNRRVFKTPDGTVVNKIQPLVISPDSATLATLADHNDHAPVRERDLLTKMNFNWSFNNDELLININMPDREINKNNIYITVRNVEDLNGNRTVSPIMWQVYVNKNTLVWNSEGINEIYNEHATSDVQIPVQIKNTSGKRHQYIIDGLPDWLLVDQQYGSINPEETIVANFRVDESLPIGTYSEIIYLTDEDGLSEPLKVYVQINAVCPWQEVVEQSYDRQMSLRGQVVVDGIYDTNPQDKVAAIIDDRIVGLNSITFDPATGANHIYLTIFGTAASQSKQVKFRLWQASTGRIYSLTSSENILFHNNGMAGLPPNSPVILSTSANEVQNLILSPGWNWISFNIIPDNQGALDGLFFTETPFDEGDQIKSASAMQFAEYNGSEWEGPLTHATHKQMYMVYTQHFHVNTQIAGRRLTTDDDRSVTLHQDWNSLPCLLTTDQNVTNAMADYVDHAMEGDLIKSQHAFAVFSENHRWEGSLTTLRPGEGYLFKRIGQDSVKFTFRNTHGAKQGKGGTPSPADDLPRFSTNMTLVAAVQHPAAGQTVAAYVGDNLAGIALPQVVDGDTLFFITLGADRPGPVTFVLQAGGETIGHLQPVNISQNADIPYQPNAHYGTLSQPVLLALAVSTEPSVSAFPTIFSDYVDFLIPADEHARVRIYSATGVPVAELEGATPSLRWTECSNLPAGVYFATINFNNTVTTIKLIKK